MSGVTGTIAWSATQNHRTSRVKMETAGGIPVRQQPHKGLGDRFEPSFYVW